MQPRDRMTPLRGVEGRELMMKTASLPQPRRACGEKNEKVGAGLPRILGMRGEGRLRAFHTRGRSSNAGRSRARVVPARRQSHRRRSG
jgi:hypothetical protein